MNANKDIKHAVKEAGLKLWQISDVLGCTDSTFSRKLRHELSASEKQKISVIISQLKADSSQI